MCLPPFFILSAVAALLAPAAASPTGSGNPAPSSPVDGSCPPPGQVTTFAYSHTLTHAAAATPLRAEFAAGVDVLALPAPPGFPTSCFFELRVRAAGAHFVSSPGGAPVFLGAGGGGAQRAPPPPRDYDDPFYVELDAATGALSRLFLSSGDAAVVATQRAIAEALPPPPMPDAPIAARGARAAWQADVADGAGLSRATFFGEAARGGGGGGAHVSRVRTADSFYAAAPLGGSGAPPHARALGLSEERHLGAAHGGDAGGGEAAAAGALFLDHVEHEFDEEGESGAAAAARGGGGARGLREAWAAPATWLRRLRAVRGTTALGVPLAPSAPSAASTPEPGVPSALQATGEMQLLRAATWEAFARFDCPAELRALLLLPASGSGAAAPPDWCAGGSSDAVTGWPVPLSAAAPASSRPHGLLPLWTALRALSGGGPSDGGPRVHAGRRSAAVPLRAAAPRTITLYEAAAVASHAELAAVRAGAQSLTARAEVTGDGGGGAAAPPAPSVAPLLLDSPAAPSAPLLTQLQAALVCFPPYFHDDSVPSGKPSEGGVWPCVANLTALLRDQPRAALAALGLLLAHPCEDLPPSGPLWEAVEAAAAAAPAAAALEPPLCARGGGGSSSEGYTGSQLSQRLAKSLVGALGMLSSQSPYVAEHALALLLRAPHRTRYAAAFEHALEAAAAVAAPRAPLLDALLYAVEGLRASAALGGGGGEQLLQHNEPLSAALVVACGAVDSARRTFGAAGLPAVPVRAYQARLLAILLEEGERGARVLVAREERARAVGEVALALWPAASEAERHVWRARARELPRRTAEAAWVAGELPAAARRAWDAAAIASHRDFLLQQAGDSPSAVAAMHFGALVAISGVAKSANASAREALRGAVLRCHGLPWVDEAALAAEFEGELEPAAGHGAAFAVEAAWEAQRAAAAAASPLPTGAPFDAAWGAAVAHTSVVLRAAGSLGHPDALPLLLNFTDCAHSRLRSDAIAALARLPARAALPPARRARRRLRGGDARAAAPPSSLLDEASAVALGERSEEHAEVTAWLADALQHRDGPFAAALFPEAAPHRLSALHYGARGAARQLRLMRRGGGGDGAPGTGAGGDGEGGGEEYAEGSALPPLRHAGLFPPLAAVEHAHPAGAGNPPPRRLSSAEHAAEHGSDVEAHLLGLALYHTDADTQAGAVDALARVAPLRPATLDALADYYEARLLHLHAANEAAVAAGAPPATKEQALEACAAQCLQAEPLCIRGILLPHRCREECDESCRRDYGVARAVQELLHARVAREAALADAAHGWYRGLEEAAAPGVDARGALLSAPGAAALAVAAAHGRALCEAAAAAHAAGAALPRHTLVDAPAFEHGVVYATDAAAEGDGGGGSGGARHLARLLARAPPSSALATRARALSHDTPLGAAPERLRARARRLGVTLIDLVAGPTVSYGEDGSGKDFGAGFKLDVGLTVSVRVSLFDARAMFDLGSRAVIWAAFFGYRLNIVTVKVGVVYGMQLVVPLLGSASDFYGNVWGKCVGKENCGIVELIDDACGWPCGTTGGASLPTSVKMTNALRDVATLIDPLIGPVEAYAVSAATVASGISGVMTLLHDASLLDILAELRAKGVAMNSSDTLAALDDAASRLATWRASVAELASGALGANGSAAVMDLSAALLDFSASAVGLSGELSSATISDNALASQLNDAVTESAPLLAAAPQLALAASSCLEGALGVAAALGDAAAPLLNGVGAAAGAVASALAFGGVSSLPPCPPGLPPLLPTLDAIPGSAELAQRARFAAASRDVAALLEQLRKGAARVASALVSPALADITPQQAAALPPSLRVSLPADTWGSPAAQAAALAALPTPVQAAAQELQASLDSLSGLACALGGALDASLEGGWAPPSGGAASAAAAAAALANATPPLAALVNLTVASAHLFSAPMALQGALRRELLPALAAAASLGNASLGALRSVRAQLAAAEAALNAQAALNSSVAALAGALEAQLPLLSNPGVLAVAAAATDSWRAAAALMGGAATGGLMKVSPVALQASTTMSSVLSLAGLFGASFGNQTAVLATVEKANGALYDYFTFLSDVDGSLFYDLSTNAASIGALASTLADQPAISAQLLDFVRQATAITSLADATPLFFGDGSSLVDVPNLLALLAEQADAIGMLLELISGNQVEEYEWARLSGLLQPPDSRGRRALEEMEGAPPAPHRRLLKAALAATPAGSGGGTGRSAAAPRAKACEMAGKGKCKPPPAPPAARRPGMTSGVSMAGLASAGSISGSFRVGAGSVEAAAMGAEAAGAAVINAARSFPAFQSAATLDAAASAQLAALAESPTGAAPSPSARRLFQQPNPKGLNPFGAGGGLDIAASRSSTQQANKADANLQQLKNRKSLMDRQRIRAQSPSPSASPVPMVFPRPSMPNMSFGRYGYFAAPCLPYINGSNAASPGGACDPSVWLFKEGLHPLGYARWGAAVATLRSVVDDSAQLAAPADVFSYNASLGAGAAALRALAAPLAAALVAAREALRAAHAGLDQLELLFTAAPSLAASAASLDAAIAANPPPTAVVDLLALRGASLSDASAVALAAWRGSAGGEPLSAALARLAPPPLGSDAWLPTLAPALAGASALGALADDGGGAQSVADAAGAIAAFSVAAGPPGAATYCALLSAALGSRSGAAANASAALGASLARRSGALVATRGAALAAASAAPAAVAALSQLAAASRALPVGALPAAAAGLGAMASFSATLGAMARAVGGNASGGDALAAALLSSGDAVRAARFALNASASAAGPLRALALPARALQALLGAPLSPLPPLIASAPDDGAAAAAMLVLGRAADRGGENVSAMLRGINASVAALADALAPAQPNAGAVAAAAAALNASALLASLDAAVAALSPLYADAAALFAAVASAPPSGASAANVGASAAALRDLLAQLGTAQPLLQAVPEGAPARLPAAAALLVAAAGQPGALSAGDAAAHSGSLAALSSALTALLTLGARPVALWAGAGSSALAAAADAAAPSFAAAAAQLAAPPTAAVRALLQQLAKAQASGSGAAAGLASGAPMLRSLAAAALNAAAGLSSALAAAPPNFTAAVLPLRELALPLAAAGSLAASARPDEPGTQLALARACVAAGGALADARVLFSAAALLAPSGDPAIAAAVLSAAEALSPFVAQLQSALAPPGRGAEELRAALTALADCSGACGAPLAVALTPLAPALLDATLTSARLAAAPQPTLRGALRGVRAAAVDAARLAAVTLPGALSAAAARGHGAPYNASAAQLARLLGGGGDALFSLLAATLSSPSRLSLDLAPLGRTLSAFGGSSYGGDLAAPLALLQRLAAAHAGLTGREGPILAALAGAGGALSTATAGAAGAPLAALLRDGYSVSAAALPTSASAAAAFAAALPHVAAAAAQHAALAGSRDAAAANASLSALRLAEPLLASALRAAGAAASLAGSLLSVPLPAPLLSLSALPGAALLLGSGSGATAAALADADAHAASALSVGTRAAAEALTQASSVLATSVALLQQQHEQRGGALLRLGAAPPPPAAAPTLMPAYAAALTCQGLIAKFSADAANFLSASGVRRLQGGIPAHAPPALADLEAAASCLQGVALRLWAPAAAGAAPPYGSLARGAGFGASGADRAALASAAAALLGAVNRSSAGSACATSPERAADASLAVGALQGVLAAASALSSAPLSVAVGGGGVSAAAAALAAVQTALQLQMLARGAPLPPLAAAAAQAQQGQLGAAEGGLLPSLAVAFAGAASQLRGASAAFFSGGGGGSGSSATDYAALVAPVLAVNATMSAFSAYRLNSTMDALRAAALGEAALASTLRAEADMLALLPQLLPLAAALVSGGAAASSGGAAAAALAALAAPVPAAALRLSSLADHSPGAATLLPDEASALFFLAASLPKLRDATGALAALQGALAAASAPPSAALASAWAAASPALAALGAGFSSSSIASPLMAVVAGLDALRGGLAAHFNASMAPFTGDAALLAGSYDLPISVYTIAEAANVANDALGAAAAQLASSAALLPADAAASLRTAAAATRAFVASAPPALSAAAAAPSAVGAARAAAALDGLWAQLTRVPLVRAQLGSALAPSAAALSSLSAVAAAPGSAPLARSLAALDAFSAAAANASEALAGALERGAALAALRDELLAAQAALAPALGALRAASAAADDAVAKAALLVSAQRAIDEGRVAETRADLIASMTALQGAASAGAGCVTARRARTLLLRPAP
jgi:hypothetical protein